MKDSSKRTIMMAGAIPLAQMFKHSTAMKKRTNTIMNTANPDEAIHELLVKLLRKLPMLRTEEETTSIAAFLSTLPSIANNRQQITDDHLRHLANNCRLLEAKEMDIVCKVGDPPVYVYYIIEGQVTVTSLKAPKYDPPSLNANSLSVMGPKTSFGEVSVLSNSARTASCVCSKTSKIILINGRAYFQIFSSSLVKERQQKVSVFVNNPLFSNWPLPNLMAFYESLARQTNKRHYGEIIVAEGQKSDKLYIIASGSVEICIPSILLAAHKQKESEMTFKKNGIDQEIEKKFRQNTVITPVLVLNEGGFFGLENNYSQEASQTPNNLIFTVKVCSGTCELYQMSYNQLMLNCPDKSRRNAVLKELQRRNRFLQEKKLLDELVIQSQHKQSVQQMQDIMQKVKESNMDVNLLQAQKKEDKQVLNLLQTRKVPELQISNSFLNKLRSSENIQDDFLSKPDQRHTDAQKSSHIASFSTKKKDCFETEVKVRNPRVFGNSSAASSSVLSSRTPHTGELSSFEKNFSAREFLIRCSYRPQELKKFGEAQTKEALSAYTEQEDTILETRRYLGNSIAECSFSDAKATSEQQNGSNFMVTALPEASVLDETERDKMKALISSKLIEEERGPVAARLVKIVQERKQKNKIKIIKGFSPSAISNQNLKDTQIQLNKLVEVKGNSFLPKLKRQETGASSTFDVTDSGVGILREGKELKPPAFEKRIFEYHTKDILAIDADIVSFSAR
jgi:CRP-like cAMP-binding protein